MLILILGGGFLGLSGLLSAVITIIRFQKSLILGYGVVALLAFLLSSYMVRRYAMMGAAVLYMVLMGILCLCFIIFFAVGIVKGRREVTSKHNN